VKIHPDGKTQMCWPPPLWPEININRPCGRFRYSLPEDLPAKPCRKATNSSHRFTASTNRCWFA